MRGIGLFTTLCAILAISIAYPSGPPTSVCSSMMPSHGANPTSSVSGAIVIQLNVTDTYWDNRTIEVQIDKSNIMGFMVEARMKDQNGAFSTAVGTFEYVSGDGKTITCNHPKSTWAHKDRTVKNKPVAIWTAPDYDQGEIVFIATVVEKKDTFWTNQRSVTLKPYAGYPTTVAPLDTTPGGASQLQSITFLPAVLIYLFVSTILS